MTRISAVISAETQAQVDAYVKHLRIWKAVLIEQALQYHLQALREIPSELMIPPRLVLDRDSFEQVVGRLERDEPPTHALRILMR